MNERTCDCHSGMKKAIVDIEVDIGAIFKALDRKTPLWSFILLVGLIVGSLGLQWANYTRIGEINIKIAVIEQRVTAIELQARQVK